MWVCYRTITLNFLIHYLQNLQNFSLLLIERNEFWTKVDVRETIKPSLKGFGLVRDNAVRGRMKKSRRLKITRLYTDGTPSSGRCTPNVRNVPISAFFILPLSVVWLPEWLTYSIPGRLQSQNYLSAYFKVCISSCCTETSNRTLALEKTEATRIQLN